MLFQLLLYVQDVHQQFLKICGLLGLLIFSLLLKLEVSKVVAIQWTGILGWTTGLTYFGFYTCCG